MYINPFVAGILATIFVEVIWTFVASLAMRRNNRGGKK
jgi:hypothetical protein